MSQSRESTNISSPPPQSLQEIQKQQTVVWKNIVLGILTGGLAGTTVAMSTYPIDVIQTRLQVGKSRQIAQPSITALLYGLYASLKLSWLRNGVMSQREKVHDNVHETFTEKGVMPTSRQRIAATFTTASVIGSFDTIFTNYYRIYRTVTSLGVTPFFATWKQKIIFAQIAFKVNLSRNCFNAFFCVAANTMIAPVVNQFNPSPPYPVINLFFTNIFAGFMSGVVITPLDVIAKRIVNEFDLATFTTPSAWQVTKNLYKTEGLSPFYKGTGWNIVSSFVVFAILNGIDFDKYGRLLLYMPLNEERGPRVTPVLFQPPAATAQATPDIEDKTKTVEQVTQQSPRPE